MRRALSPLLLLALSACSRVGVQVRSYSDPEAEYPRYRSFKTQVAGKENPLLEKELLRLARLKLESKGLKHDPAAADLIVTLHSFSGPFKSYVPPSVSYHSVYQPGETEVVYGQVGDKQINVVNQRQGRWENIP